MNIKELEKEVFAEAPKKLKIKKWIPPISDYVAEASAMIMANMFSRLQMMHERDNVCQYEILNMMRNLLAIGGKFLVDTPDICDYIENVVQKMPSVYSRTIVFEMIKNVKHRSPNKNIYLRNIQEAMPAMPPMPIEDRLCIERKLKNYARVRHVRKKPPKFRVDQIVGARDKENRWWLSRVLYVHDDAQSPHIWYYVHFEGWTESSREWVTEGSWSIRQYNPRKHPLRRF